MKTLIFETSVKETKNSYTTTEILSEFDTKFPIMKKVLYGVEIKNPTSYRIYKFENGAYLRTWVFGDIEINPNRFNLDKIKA